MPRRNKMRKISLFRNPFAKRTNTSEGKSLKSKLIIWSALILIVPSMIIGILAYQSAKSNIENEIVSSANQNVQLLSHLLDATFIPKLEEASFLAARLNEDLFTDLAYKELHTHLKDFLNASEGLQTVYVGTEDGKFIAEPAVELPADFDPRKRPWYQQAMEHKGQAVITSPYVDASSGEYVLTVTVSLKDGNGVLGFDLKVDSLKNIISKVKIGEKGYPFVMDTEKKIAFHPTLKPGEFLDFPEVDMMYESTKGQLAYEFEGISKQMFYVTNPTTGWKIAGSMNNSEAQEASKSIFHITSLVIAITLVIGSFVVFLGIQSIIRPIRNIITVTKKVSEGDLTERIEVSTNDEIGQMGTSFNKMIDFLRELLVKINDSSQHLAASIEQLSGGSEQTAQTTRKITMAIKEVAAGSKTQMTGTEESARAMEEISGGIQQIAIGASIASDSSITASNNVQKGNHALEQVVAQMNSINDSVNEGVSIVRLLGEHSREIGKIIEVITQISEQTNLLALNAAIEAARAGEHGKGFAVVAEEVRKLAEETKASANQISQLINTIQEDTAKAVVSMEKGETEVKSGFEVVSTAGEAFKKILQSIQQVTEQAQEASATSQEISASVEEVTAAVGEVATIASEAAASTDQVATSSEMQLETIQEITQSINELSKLAIDLQETVDQFKME
ncbi:methyl-accepting chemotaxis protein [Priestia megaterium]|nr:methyl-accepting chemotaxis protein [Priestia megaterium]